MKRIIFLLKKYWRVGIFVLVVAVAVYSSVMLVLSYKNRFLLSEQIVQLKGEKEILNNDFNELKNQDQVLINKKLQEEIGNIHETYLKAVGSFEDLLDLKAKTSKTEKLDELLAVSLKYLADRNYASASATLITLASQIKTEEQKLVTAIIIPANVAESNTPPGSGYQRQKVKTDAGEFMVSIISADLNTTKVIVDTASESDCADNCPVMALAEYVSRSGAFAGVNGSYFCPAIYPQCAAKKNSFDTLLMNKNKKYFNSDNNVYSPVPAVIFSGNSARFVRQSLEWGRDTGVDAVIANQPLLVLNNAIVFGGDSDAKHSNKGGRSFVGVTGSMVYIGVVHNATVLESAKVLYALGIHNSLNLDDGGSTALWHSGYKVGPGRNLPNVILLVKK